MNTTFKIAIGVLLIGGAVIIGNRLKAAEESSAASFEYVTLRWAGRENTHLIRPSGEVEFVGSQLSKIKRPERTDDRSFNMNVAMNTLAKQGYELVAMTPDDYVMKRRVTK